MPRSPAFVSASWRMTSSGISSVGTFVASAPSSARRMAAISAIQSSSPVARNRSPAATLAVIARTWSAATSRTSTTSRPMRGTPGISPRSIRPITCTEPRLAVVRIGPNTAPGRIVVRPVLPVAGPDEVPRGALGQRLRAPVRRQLVVVQVGPQRLVGDAVGGVRRRARRVRRRCHHHPFDTCGQRRADDTTGAAERRHDQCVVVTVGGCAERRGDVQHEPASVDRSSPALVGGEVGDAERQSLARIDLRDDRGAHAVGLCRVAHGGAHVEPRP